MEQLAFIYGLHEQNSDIIRYVGKTIQQLKVRLKSHIQESKRENRTYKQKWINKTLKNNKKVCIKLLETVKLSEWEEKETFWVNKLNENLTNLAVPGKGGGVVIYKISYEDASKKIQNLKIKTRKEWNELLKKENNFNLPSNPNVYFKDKGWKNWRHYLFGDKMKYVSFDEAKRFVKEKNIITCKEWQKFCASGNKPYNIPSAPNKLYKKDWKSWNDFFGNKIFSNNTILSFEEFKKYLKFNNIKNRKEWRVFCNKKLRSINFPSHPEISYKNEWKGWRFLFKK